jgi:simple sugar transport system substrate-binding protein
MPSIWYINPLTAYPLFNDSAAVFKAAAAKDGYQATVVGSSTINIPQQITLINQAITSGANAVIFCDLDPATYQSTIQAAEAKGVVMITTSCTDTISNYSVGTDNVAFGQRAANTIAENVGKKANVVTFGVNLTTPNQAASYNAFVAYAKKHYPKMKVTFVADNGSPTTTATELESLPQAYPKANAIWFLEGGDDSIIASSLKHAGKKPGAYYVLAIDALPTTLSEIKSGYVSETLAQCYFWATPFAAQLAMAKLNGNGPTQQSYSIPVQVVGKKQLPYQGCPSSFYPTLPSS